MVASAQVPPDAGRIQEQLRSPELPKQPAAPQIRIEPAPGEAKADTPAFYVASFRVSGATVFPEQRLVALLGEPRRPMRLAEVQALADRITELYRSQGYLVARALIPAQDVRDGIADLAGVQPKATLEAGTQPGFTNLILELVPTTFAQYDLTVDNAGSRYTGRNRLSAGVTLNSPLGIGDRLSARAVTSGANLNSVQVSYDAPLGYSSVRAGAYATDTTYKLGDQFTTLDASGSARSYGAMVVY